MPGRARWTRRFRSRAGITRASLTDDLELRALPGVFAAGEMLDWEAPTGGYLLTAAWPPGSGPGSRPT
jgi:predicted flavoprotein YhiN